MLRGNKDTLTTGDVSWLFSVAPRTVSQWYDKGILPGYRIPSGSCGKSGSPRRFRISDVLDFAHKHNIRLRDNFHVAIEVLFVGLPSQLVISLIEILGAQLRLASAINFFMAGVVVGKEKPDIVVLDFLLGRSDAFIVAQQIKNTSAWSRVIALAGEDDSLLKDDTPPFDRIVHRPFSPSSLVIIIQDMLQKQKTFKGKKDAVNLLAEK